MFNEQSRIKNLLLSSSFGGIEQLITYACMFAYRTVFLYILTKSYLGITGLFTNILQLFSLTELGIGGVISFRLYKPIKEKDIRLCGALINFYKNIYRIIAFIVFLMGASFYPFLNSLIHDTSEVPADVSLSVVYWLFVFQSVTSYFCVYTQSLIIADQKNYIVSIANIIYQMCVNLIQILILIVSKNYTLSLAMGIIINFLYNYLFSLYIKKQYMEVFLERTKLDRNQKYGIYKDCGSLMCHKIGYIILNSTDNLILLRYKGFEIQAIYSNYAMIALAIDTMLNKLLGSFVATIGNVSLDKDKKENYEVYKKLIFLNFWFSSFCSITFFCMANTFIDIWLNDSFLLETEVVFVIAVNLFINSSGIINAVYINANGLFVKDRLRPLIQAIINLFVSIVLVEKVGVSGVFIGTLISNVLTTWWRQPLIVHKYIFEKKSLGYFRDFVSWLFISFIIGTGLSYLFKEFNKNLFFLFMEAIICILFVNLAFYIINKNNESLQYYKKLVIKNFRKRKGKADAL